MIYSSMRKHSDYWLMAGMILTFVLITNGCDDESVSPQISGGESFAGESLAGETGGGDPPLTGGTTAGTEIAGAETAGTEAGSEVTIGPMPGGDLVAAGESAGDLAGDMAGESAGSEAGQVAGEMTNGGNELCPSHPEWTPAEQRGSVYLTHYLTSEVIEYKVSGEFPEERGRFNVGGEPQDAAIDINHQLYAVALNLNQEVELYRLPAGPEGEGFVAPEVLSRINLSPNTPRRVLFDSARERLYVYANPPLDGGLLEQMLMFTYDVSDPSTPLSMNLQPTTLPVSSALAIEPRAGTLALVESGTHLLYLYDIGGTQMTPHQGEAIDLRILFPEDGGQAGFQVRNLKFDPLRGRLFMARSHGVASEVISFSYPPVENKPEGSAQDDCPPSFSYEDLSAIPDDFEVSEPSMDRPNLLDAFVAIPMIGEELVLFINYAWRGSSIASMVSLMRDNGARLSNEAACGDYEGFGCFYTSYYNGSPSPYNHRTDGPGCVDQTHGIFAGAGLEDDENSSLFLFRINRETGAMSPLLTEAGRNLSTSAYPLVLSCY